MNIGSVVGKERDSRENLLQILHDMQDRTGCNALRRDDLEAVARAMSLSVADVVSTATFYSMFSLVPRGRHVIRLCESPPCYIMGEENIRQAIGEKLGIDFNQTTDDGMFTLEPSSCLGSCGVGPVMMIDDEIYGNLTGDRVCAILDQVAAADMATLDA